MFDSPYDGLFIQASDGGLRCAAVLDWKSSFLISPFHSGAACWPSSLCKRVAPGSHTSSRWQSTASRQPSAHADSNSSRRPPLPVHMAVCHALQERASKGLPQPGQHAQFGAVKPWDSILSRLEGHPSEHVAAMCNPTAGQHLLSEMQLHRA